MKENRIKIEKFNPKYLIEILKLETEVFGINSFSPSYFLSLIENNRYFYVVRKKEDIIGYILAGAIDEKEIKIISIAIKPNYQRRGIGSKLMRKLVEKIEKKYDLISLEVRTNNKKALSFYYKLGFSKEKILYDYYQDDENAFYLETKPDKLIQKLN